MSEQRLSSVRFSNKRKNIWSVDLNTSSVYSGSGDRLLDQSAFQTSRQADTLLINGQALSQGGSLFLGSGKDILILQLEELTGENLWIINTGKDDDRLELHQTAGAALCTLKDFNIQMESGNDQLILGPGWSMKGSSSRNSSISTGLGRDTIELSQATLSYLDIDTGLGEDKVQLLNVENSNITTGDDNDVVTLLHSGLIIDSFLSLGAGDDSLDLRGSVTRSSIDTSSGDDYIDSRAAQSIANVEINTGDGDDILIAAILADCSVQSGDGHDEITAYLSGVNDITLNDGDDLFRLTGFIGEGSSINAGTGHDVLHGEIDLLITSFNKKGLPSYTESITDSGAFVFTYFGDTEAPLLTLIGFEQLIFANATFNNIS